VGIFIAAEEERKADAGSSEKKGREVHRERKGFVINYNKFIRVGRRHSSGSVVKTRTINEFFLSCWLPKCKLNILLK
jgi:hypothetical protein